MLSQLLKTTAILVISLAFVSPVLGENAANGEPRGGASWIDVRTPQEYAEGHVSQAINIPHEQILEGVETLHLPKDQPIYVYCGSGRRAGIARDALMQAGYTDVTNLGGLDDALEVAGESDGGQLAEEAGD